MPSCPPLGVCCRGTITRVIDGDTLVFKLWDVLPIHIRLLANWAAETRKAKSIKERMFGEQAKRRLKDLAEGQAACFALTTSQADDFGDVISLDRVLGEVWLKDRPEASLSDTMRAEGLAFATKPELQAAVAAINELETNAPVRARRKVTGND